jgi:DNA-binding transcriptional LysR family regulator
MAPDLNLNRLRAFYFAVNCGSISRAAEELFVSQPAVSMQIKALEDQYGVRLFVKKKRKLELTLAGRRLYHVAEQLFDLVRDAEKLLLQHSTLAPDILKIGSTKTCVRYLLAGYISSFQEFFPKIHIEVNEGSSEEMIESVLEARSDLAIVGRLPYNEKLKVVPFSRDEILFLAAPDHRLSRKETVSMEDVTKEKLILREKGSGTRQVVEQAFKASGIVTSAFIESGNVDFIKELVQMGKGITMLARMGVDPDLRAGRLVALPVNAGPFDLEIDIVYNAERKLSKLDEAFLDMLMSQRKDKNQPDRSGVGLEPSHFAEPDLP